MINHTVLWIIKPEIKNKKSKIELIKKELLQLKDKIKEIHTIEVQTNDPKASNSNFDIALISTFSDLQTLDNYQKHPEHQKVGEIIKKLVSSRAAIDYYFENGQ